MPYILGVLIIIIDQLTKYAYVACGAKHVTIIDGILSLSYVENKGAAWGMFRDSQLLLYIFSGLLVLAMIFVLIRYYKKFDKLMRCALALVIAGAIGNMIDRVFLSYVRDMIQFTFISFPVFNVADMSITIGGVLLIIDCLFADGRKLFHDKEHSTEPIDENFDVNEQPTKSIDENFDVNEQPSPKPDNSEIAHADSNRIAGDNEE